ncbi:MAG: terminase gpA endonuclease subunit [Chthoniobacteraceae bacterium]
MSFLDPRAWLRGLIRATLRSLPRGRIADWVEAHVIVPEDSGGPFPGPLRWQRFPIVAGLLDLAQQRGIHFVTLCASARVGKTLFSICLLLYWIAERFGHAAWLDPSGISAKRFVRNELEAYLLQCKPVRALAIITRTAWTTLWKTFRGKLLRILASGAEADMHGFNVELLIANELDRCKAAIEKDAASDDKLEARTILFPHSRLIVRNSTPGDKGEFSPIWFHFRRGSQHHCYVPCPHCTDKRRRRRLAKNRKLAPFEPPKWKHCTPGRSPLSYDPDLAGWQRITFFTDKKLVPFDEHLEPLRDKTGRLLPHDQWREEITGQIKFDRFAIYEDRASITDPTKFERVKVGYDLDAVAAGASYECAHCKKEIENIDLGWMIARFRWIAHNPGAPRDRLSAHLWTCLCPFVPWGVVAKEFLECKGNLGALIKFWNLWLGLPFVRERSAIKEEDLDRVIARTPISYIQGQLPLEPEVLTICIDVQGMQFWWCIRAWGVHWAHPDWPSWSALVDWGEATNWAQILELCGLADQPDGTRRKFTFTRPDGTVSEHVVTAGFVDFGWEAYENKNVAEFCQANSAVFSPMKGSDPGKLRGSLARTTPVFDDRLDLILFWSDYFAADLYYTCIKDGFTIAENGQKPVLWWLPRTLDRHYREQLTAERQVEENARVVWKPFGPNHLGDCEKEQRVVADTIERRLSRLREERRKAMPAAPKPD